MISAHGFFGRKYSICDQAEHLDERKLVRRVVDLPSEQGGARAVFLGVMDQFEGVVGRASTTAEDADDEVGVILGELLHGARAVIHDFQKERAASLGHTSQAADDAVIDELAELLRRDAPRDVRIEDLEKVAEVLALGFFAEFFEGDEGSAVLLQIVEKRD